MLAWDDLRVFAAVARRGSHAAAGRALGVASTTIGRRIAVLERDLGVRLFERTPDGLVATEAGRALGAHAARVEEEIEAAERSLRGADARLAGTVRLTAGDGLMTYVLVPALVDFRRAHPAVHLELRGDNRALDLARGEADVAVRMFRPREATLVARKLGTMPFGIFASEAYLARRATPRTVRDLAQHDWVAYDATVDAAPQGRWRARNVPNARIVVRSSTTTALVTACVAGHGVSILPSSYATAGLVRLLPRVSIPTREVWAVVHPDVRLSARVDALVRFLEGLFA